ncbi:hypothetical protein ABWK22_02000 [Gottfriedia acidiceleris]|uniref:hypothetical protein n=1 Tax=Gottfriedia acidiceleris TaxID=371036 RepID=UPI003393A58E
MNSVNIGWFLLSQTIIGFGTYAIMSAIFQLSFRRYLKVVIIISFLNSLINYLIYFNKEAEIGYIVPIMGGLITFIYLTGVIKIPMVWSLIVTATGSIIIPTIIQIGILFGSFGFFMPAQLKEHIWRNYAIDITSGIVYCIIAFILYTRGWSFQFDFGKFRFKREKYLVIVITICAALCMPVAIVLTHIKDVSLNLTFLSISSLLVFLFLLSYAVKKEKDEIKLLNPLKEVESND